MNVGDKKSSVIKIPNLSTTYSVTNIHISIRSLQFILIDSTAPLRVRYSTWHACGTSFWTLLLFRLFVGISQIYPILIFCFFGPAHVNSQFASFMVPSDFILTQSSAPFSSSKTSDIKIIKHFYLSKARKFTNKTC